MTQEANPFDPAIAAMEAKRDRLSAMIDELKLMRDEYISMPSGQPTTRSAAVQTEAAFSHDAFFGMTIQDAARKYLTAHKRTASVPVLSAALLNGGLKSASKKFSETLRAILTRHPDFVRINGEFGLAEWYPGARKSAKRRASGLAATAEEEQLMADVQDESESITAASARLLPA